MNTLICPISSEKINRSVVRITGFLVAATIVIYALTGSITIILALLIDFFIRAFTSLKISPYSWLARKISQIFKLKVIRIDKAPKLFAARIGFLFATSVALLYYVSPISSLVVAFVLMSFALLESVFNICVGCIVYT
ncbi:MAG: DUF4395 domain-containing protein, partial [Vallitaleaceae bacterium]|nr:DUF4395 domain-containing protein [Vallitaleaceae bacterium]